MCPLLFAVFLLCATPALADWEGTVRVDQTMPMGRMVLLMDFKTKSLNMLMPERKQYMSLDGGAAQSATLPPAACLDQKVDACLTGQGFKKGAAETVSGRKTTLWEQERDRPGGKIQQKLWVVDGAKEMMFLRQSR